MSWNVTVLRVPHGGKGHPSYRIDENGGRLELGAQEACDSLTIDIYPDDNLTDYGRRHRSYDELVALSHKIDAHGGAMRSTGPESDHITVDGASVGGRELIDLMFITLREQGKQIARLEGKDKL
jgi:hypothetical protein